jgi:SAM-dependent methyltransferase
MAMDFDALVSEAAAVPITGWDFSWLDGRASEERPPWGYSGLVAQRLATVASALDIQTGGGEVLAGLDVWPPLLVATETWAPNAAVAGPRLGARGGRLVMTSEDHPGLPFRAASFDLVTSRHPVVTWWDEVARVLRPGGSFLSQQVGAGTVAELAEVVLGPLPPGPGRRTPDRARVGAEEAGLVVSRLEEARLRTEFHDIGAVVYFLRLVVWIVPDFSVDRYRPALRRLHDRIQAEGSFVTYSRRFLIEATRPG